MCVQSAVFWSRSEELPGSSLDLVAEPSVPSTYVRAPAAEEGREEGAGQWSQGVGRGGEALRQHGAAYGGQFLKKYAAPPVQDDGRSTAIYEALGEPHAWATPDGLVEKMSSRSTELTNRRSVGLSEAAGTLESLNQAIVDASLPVKAVWCELWSKNDMSTTVQILYSHGYPDLARSQEEITRQSCTPCSTTPAAGVFYGIS